MENYDKYGFQDTQKSQDPFKKAVTESDTIELDSNLSPGNTQTDFKDKNSAKNLLDLKRSIKSEGEDLMSNDILTNELQNEGIEVKNGSKSARRSSTIGSFFSFFGDFFTEIQYLWKKEELIDCLDANGNHVKRPKNKIPLKHDPNKSSQMFKKADQEANSKVCDNAKQGINYGFYFN